MKTHSKRSILLLCGCLFGIHVAVTARAEDIYVAESTRGTGSGSSASNAKSVAWFNSSGNWSSTKTSGKVGPGDTVRLVGTITTPLTIQASGSAGSPITILFSKDAKMSSPAWPSSGAIAVHGKHYITINGGENGLIENTANGTAGSFLNSTSATTGIYGTGANNLSIIGVRIQNLYVRTSETDTAAGGIAVRTVPALAGTFNGLRVSQCIISDVGTGIAVNYRPIEVTDIEISHNRVFNVNHGIRVGDSENNSRCSNVRIHNNVVYDFQKWDEPASNKYHHNGIFCFATNGGSELRNVQVYSNTIGSNFGRYSTSGIYFSGWIFDSVIYNNILRGDINTPSNGLVTLRLRANSDVSVYNNTFIGNGQYGRAIHLNGQDTGVKKAYIANNIATRITFISVTYSANWIISSDYNLGQDLIENRHFSTSGSSSAGFKSFASWQSMGYDLNSYLSDALLDANHVPTRGSPAIDSAKNMSSLFNSDKSGVIRPVGSGWDIGAYESMAGLTGVSSITDSSSQVASGDTTAPSTGTSSGDVVIDFTEPTTTLPTTEPVTEEPVIVADSSTSTGSTGTTTDTAPSTEDTIEVVFEPAPAPDTSTSEPVIVADSSPSTDSSTSEPVSAGNTLEPPTTSEPVIVADSSTSTDTSTAPVSSPSTTEPVSSTDSSTVVVVDSSTSEPAPSTDSSTIVVVDSSTGTDSNDTSTESPSQGKPGNGYGRDTNGKMTKTARIL